MSKATLAQGARGDEVRRLHDQLEELGIPVDVQEREQALFGQSSAQAVLDLQRVRGLPQTGEADEVLLAIIIVLVDEHRRHHHHGGGHGHGGGGHGGGGHGGGGHGGGGHGGGGNGGGGNDGGGGGATGNVVTGVVVQATGAPLQKTIVRAFAKSLRHQVQLGEDTTDADGQFSIPWKTSQAPAITAGTAALAVQAFATDGSVLASSSLAFNPTAQTELDLIVGGSVYLGASEYEQLIAAITPALDGAVIANLTADDVTFLSQESQYTTTVINDLVIAQQFSAQTSVSDAAFYGFFREALPQDLPSLLGRSSDEWRAALSDALGKNVVPATLQSQLDAIVNQLSALAKSSALAPPPANQPATLGSVLAVNAIDPTIQSAFVDLFLANKDDAATFWNNVAADPRFSGSGVVDQLQRSVLLGALTVNHPPLMKALVSTSPLDLVKLDEAGWRKYIDGAGTASVGVPPGTPGDTDEARSQLYARALVRAAQDTFPTAAISYALTSANTLTDAASYLAAHADYDVYRTDPATFVAANPPTSGNQTQLIQSLTHLRLLTRVAQMPGYVTPLYKAGFRSAQSIAQTSPDLFAQKVSSFASREQALTIHMRARTITNVGNVLYAKLAGTYNLPKLAVTASATDALKQFPNLETLFGDMPLCDCPDCQSVISPAAYLVDLLYFINQHNPAALNELDARRPEIQDLQLTCDNTLTPLPYIDLVNEVLENIVLGNTPAPSVANQTTWTADELAANPQYIQPAAYDTLRDKAAFPWSLPFDLWSEEARVYLTHLGVDRVELMRRLQSSTGPTPTDVQFLQELLRMTATEWTLIATAGTSIGDPKTYWGTTNLGGLSQVEAFLQATGLLATDLPNLLSSDFVNPVRSSGRTIGLATNATCDPSSQDSQLTGLDSNALDRICRFVRLWRRLGWTMSDLDAAIAALGADLANPAAPPQLNASSLAKIVALESLRRTLSVPVTELLMWWTNLLSREIDGQPSLYEALFLNNTLANPSETLGAFKLDANGEIALYSTAVANGSPVPLLNDNLPGVLAGLATTADQIAPIVSAPAGGSHNWTYFNVDTLTQLYRALSISRALGITTSDFSTLRSFISVNPLEPSAPATSEIVDAATFIRIARRLLAGPLSLAQLDYLFHDVDDGDGVALDDETSIAIVDQLRSGLKTIAAALAADQSDPNYAAVVKRKLGVLLAQSDLDGAIAILAGAPNADYTKVDVHFGDIAKSTTPPLDLTLLRSAPPDQLPATIQKRYAVIEATLLKYVADRDRHTLVQTQVASALSTSLTVTVTLLSSPFSAPSPASAGTAPIDVLLDDIMTGSDSTTDPSDPTATKPNPALAAQFNTVALLYKQAIVVVALKLTADELDFWVSNLANLKWVDPRLLPITGPSSTIGYDALAGLLDYVDLRNQQPTGAHPLLGVFADAIAGKALPDLLLDVAASTGWETPQSNQTPDLAMLVAHFGLSAASFTNQSALVQLAPAVRILQRAGVPAAKLVQWAQPLDATTTPAPISIANDIRAAAKSKHSQADWLTIAKKLRDPLREKQRDALVAWATGNWLASKLAPNSLPDTNALFNYLLIDAEMGACQLTSRIKLAIGATQLFIQRCLTNLEDSNLALGPIAARQWSWMQSYSVWASNRLVFLYPENWIEPELRDDKTSFFQALEQDLSQGAITTDAVEQAYRNYLEKLQDVARLEVVGVFDQSDAFDPAGYDATNQDPQATHALHVIARTYSAPHTYYYRRRERGYLWTPWEKVNLDIVGDHVLPVVWNRRLHLFWAEIAEKTDQTQSAKVPDTSSAGSSSPPQKPPLHREIRISWSEYKDNKWLAKKTSKGFISVGVYGGTGTAMSDLPAQTANSYIVLKAEMETGSDALRIRVLAVDPPDHSPPIAIHFGNGPIDPGFFLDSAIVPALRPVGGIGGGDGGGYHPPPKQGPPKTGGGGSGTGGGGGSVATSWTSAIFQFTACSSEPQPTFTLVQGRSLIEPTNAVVEHQGCRGFDFPVYFNRPGDTGLFTAPPEKREYFALSTNAVALYTLGKAVGDDYWSVYPSRDGQFFFTPFFFADEQRSFFVTRKPPAIVPQPPPVPQGPIIFERPQPLPASSVTSNAFVAFLPSAIGDYVDRYMRTDLVPAPALVGTAPIQALNPNVVAWAPAPNIGLPVTDALQFQTFYHPYVCEFLKRLAIYGIDGLLRWDQPPSLPQPPVHPVQLLADDSFSTDYQPNPLVVAKPYPKDEVSFCVCDAYSQYNWELFFHIPFYIANQLSHNQQFEDAQKWYHYIFDPTTDVRTDPQGLPAPSCYWKLTPFQKDGTGESILDILQALANGGEVAQPQDDCPCGFETLSQQIADWQNDPFNPHLIARQRISAYQKAVVIKYLDNLIAWGDQLFTRDTIESINQATQLYVLAAQILGPKPQGIPAPPPPTGYTWRQMLASGDLQPFDDELESMLPPTAPAQGGYAYPFTMPPQLVFCVPPNTQLMAYWDAVADRLFKIRHCQNIQGQAQQLPLFEPPINPALLVAAAAGGVDLSTALNDSQASVPHYRFTVMLQKANELAADLRALGAGLLSALEKQDAEHLALLRANQEIAVLQAIRAVKAAAIDEAQHSIDAVTAGRAAIDTRQQFYGSRDFMNAAEIAAMTLSTASAVLQVIASGLQIGSAVAAYIPGFQFGVVGIGGSPMATSIYGGENVSNGLDKAGQVLSLVASSLNIGASLATTIGGYQRRKDEWDMQAKALAFERTQADNQILAAQVRQQMAQGELDAHDLQISNAQSVAAFMQSKYTDEQLFQWMAGQIKTIYFQSYQLAFDLARRAERAYRFELGVFDDSSIVQFGYWDNLKQGLLAGERLQADLRRLEATYLDQNARELEVTKHVSLALTDPVALTALKANGWCVFDLPEALFDADYPGHYMRRLKSVAVTIPCVTGPYTTVSCPLALTAHHIRFDPTSSGSYPRQQPRTHASSIRTAMRNRSSPAPDRTTRACSKRTSATNATSRSRERARSARGASTSVTATWRSSIGKRSPTSSCTSATPPAMGATNCGP